MREIKFRAFTGKQMVYSEESSLEDFFFGVREGEIKEVMQYTGITDKNGKDVYEGDIVEDGDRIYKIKWNSLYASFAVHHLIGFCTYSDLILVPEMEIIGDIYENSELLKP